MQNQGVSWAMVPLKAVEGKGRLSHASVLASVVVDSPWCSLAGRVSLQSSRGLLCVCHSCQHKTFPQGHRSLD